MHKPIHLLIDGDISYHRACRRKDENGDPVSFEDAIQHIKDHYDWLMHHLGADRMTVCLSPDSGANFRKALYPPYKGDRDGERPALLDMVKAWLMDNYKVELWDELEADDVLGILSTAPQDEEQRIIVSIDKDLEQIPGYLFNPGKYERGVVHVTEKEADMKFYGQWLTGDATDCYPGIPGIGPKKAEKLLEAALAEHAKLGPEVDWREFVENVIIAQYGRYQLTYDYAVTQARLARILRHEDYDELGVFLWIPRQQTKR